MAVEHSEYSRGSKRPKSSGEEEGMAIDSDDDPDPKRLRTRSPAGGAVEPENMHTLVQQALESKSGLEALKACLSGAVGEGLLQPNPEGYNPLMIAVRSRKTSTRMEVIKALLMHNTASQQCTQKHPGEGYPYAMALKAGNFQEVAIEIRKVLSRILSKIIDCVKRDNFLQSLTVPEDLDELSGLIKKAQGMSDISKMHIEFTNLFHQQKAWDALVAYREALRIRVSTSASGAVGITAYQSLINKTHTTLQKDLGIYPRFIEGEPYLTEFLDRVSTFTASIPTGVRAEDPAQVMRLSGGGMPLRAGADHQVGSGNTTVKAGASVRLDLDLGDFSEWEKQVLAASSFGGAYAAGSSDPAGAVQPEQGDGASVEQGSTSGRPVSPWEQALLEMPLLLGVGAAVHASEPLYPAGAAQKDLTLTTTLTEVRLESLGHFHIHTRLDSV
jgi:hypothetical protein